MDFEVLTAIWTTTVVGFFRLTAGGPGCWSSRGRAVQQELANTPAVPLLESTNPPRSRGPVFAETAHGGFRRRGARNGNLQWHKLIHGGCSLGTLHGGSLRHMQADVGGPPVLGFVIFCLLCSLSARQDSSGRTLWSVFYFSSQVPMRGVTVGRVDLSSPEPELVHRPVLVVVDASCLLFAPAAAIVLHELVTPRTGNPRAP